jgi:hypothetical protein
MGVQPRGHIPAGFAAHQVAGLRLLLSREHGTWLTRLASEFELVWATSWENDADELIAELVGLPRGLPVIAFDTWKAGDEGWLTKLPDVVKFVGDRPLAWVDDVLDPEVYAWAESRPAPTLLVQPDPDVGLTPSHVERLRAFALEVRRG